MAEGVARTGSRLERALRAICRCDGLKDAAVVAVLVAVACGLVVRLLGNPFGPSHHPREEYRATVAMVLIQGKC